MPFDQLSETKADLGEALRKAGQAHLFWVAKTDAAQKLVQELCDLTETHELRTGKLKRKRNKQGQASLRKSVAVWVAALIRHSQHKEAWGYLYCLSGQKMLEATCMTDRAFRSIKKAWADLELHACCSGFQQTYDFEGDDVKGKRWADRHRATPRLMELAAKHGISFDTLSDHFGTAHNKFLPIRLRARKVGEKKDEKGRFIKFKPSAQTKRLCQEIQDLNRYLEAQDFGGIPQPLFRRTYNNGDDPDFAWNKGGRLYAIGPNNYQAMNSSDREKITINRKPTSEVDVRASHLTIIYGLLQCPLDVTVDPYAIKGLDRWLAKKCIVAIIGKGSALKRWPNDLKAEYSAATGTGFPSITAKEASNLVFEHHPCLKRLENSALDWSKAQHIEAEALFEVMRTLRNCFEVPSLPVHDSLIVPMDATALAKDLIRQAFERHCGIAPCVKVK